MTIPLLLRLNDQGPPSAGGSEAPPNLGVPYILTTDKSRTLHDGATQVPLSRDAWINVIGRVAGGWLVEGMDEPGGTQTVSLLSTSGTYQPQQVTVADYEPYMTVLGSTDRMIVQSRWGNMGNNWCIKVVTLRPTGNFATLREHCGTGHARYPALSPDGRFLIVPSDKIAIEADSGNRVSLPELPDLIHPQGVVFEDADSFLALSSLTRLATSTGSPEPAGTLPTEAPTGQPHPATRMPADLPVRSLRNAEPFHTTLVSRCNAHSGKCEQIYQASTPTHIRLEQP